MNLIKFGIVGLVAVGATVVACGGSSSDDSSSKAGSGNSTSSGGSSSSTAGSTSSSGGKASGTGGKASGTAGKSSGTGGGCTVTMGMATDDSCPDGVTCIQNNCESQVDACTSSTGACSDYVKCAQACNCDTTCEENCTMSAACTSCFNTYLNCATSKCLTQIEACSNTGTGGTTGAGGTFGSGGSFSFDAGNYTCADLTKCCKTLPAGEQSDCTMVATSGIDLECSITYSILCTM